MAAQRRAEGVHSPSQAAVYWGVLEKRRLLCDAEERFGDVGARPEIADGTAVLDEPPEGALDDPAARQRLEARQGAGPRDDGQREVGLLLRPTDGFAGISAVGEHGLDEGP